MQVTAETVRAIVRELLEEHAASDEHTYLGALFDSGLIRVDFPLGCGGLGAEPKLQELVDTMLLAAGRPIPWLKNPMGIGMCAPTIVSQGTDAQRARFVRPIYTIEELWCQLFSEPDAGSDVASLATRAVRDGGEWVVNGQKVWTSMAGQADWGLLLARTDPTLPKNKGLTVFILDMHAPGVEVRPLRKITGEAGWFNEVFFNDVRIPDDRRIGEVNDGWRVATVTLMNERVALGGEILPRGSGSIGIVVDIWKEKAEKNPVRRDELMRLWVEAEVHRIGNIRAQSLRDAGAAGPEGSTLKLLGTLLKQRIANFTVDLLGPDGTLVWGYGPGAEHGPDPVIDFVDPVLSFLGVQCTTIAGGTSEIQRNIIGERILGLPREPGLDPGTPWNEIPRGVAGPVSVAKAGGR
jgi:alkylation response protein AidB-like acyl-CoA dehydrogenase